MSLTAIYEAFAERLTLFAGEYSPALPVAYPGIAFTPPDGGVWLQLRWFPNETSNYGVQNDGGSTLQGFGQVTVCSRPQSIVAALEVADSCVAYYAKGTTLASAKVERPPWASSVLEEPDRIMVPVTVRWRGTVNA